MGRAPGGRCRGTGCSPSLRGLLGEQRGPPARRAHEDSQPSSRTALGLHLGRTRAPARPGAERPHGKGNGAGGRGLAASQSWHLREILQEANQLPDARPAPGDSGTHTLPGGKRPETDERKVCVTRSLSFPERNRGEVV